MHGINLIPADEFDPALATRTVMLWTDNTRGYHSRYWTTMCSRQDDMMLLVNTEVQVHFLTDSKEDAISLISDEVVGYADESLFTNANPLIDIIIEDPIVGRISLYSKLHEFLAGAYGVLYDDW